MLYVMHCPEVQVGSERWVDLGPDLVLLVHPDAVSAAARAALEVTLRELFARRRTTGAGGRPYVIENLAAQSLPEAVPLVIVDQPGLSTVAYNPAHISHVAAEGLLRAARDLAGRGVRQVTSAASRNSAA